jgi:DNA-binding MarR family transcriptional regulator
MEQEFGIIRPEWTVLLCLEFRNYLAQKDICEITEQPSNTVSRAVRSLEQKGHIKCSVDTVDARRTVLEITASGRKLHQQILPMFIEGEAAMLAPLTDAELAKLDKLLDKLCRAVPDWHQAS